MLPGFTGYAGNAQHGSPVTDNAKASPPMILQGAVLAGIAAPGCTIECYCSLFTYKCYERCDGRITRSWDNGWCVSW